MRSSSTRQQVQKIRDEVEKNLGPDEAAIFDAHLLVLEDQALISETIREFETTGPEHRNLLQRRRAALHPGHLPKLPMKYFRERAGDLKECRATRAPKFARPVGVNLSQLIEKRIVVANDITPSDSASIDRSQALAIVHGHREQDQPRRHCRTFAEDSRHRRRARVYQNRPRRRLGDRRRLRKASFIVNPSEQTLFSLRSDPPAENEL